MVIRTVGVNRTYCNCRSGTRLTSWPLPHLDPPVNI